MKCIRLIIISRSIDIDEYEIIVRVDGYHNAYISFYVDNARNIIVPISIKIVYIPTMCGTFIYINQVAYDLGFTRALIYENAFIERYSKYRSFTTDIIKKIIQDYTDLVDPVIDELYAHMIKNKIRYKFND